MNSIFSTRGFVLLFFVLLACPTSKSDSEPGFCAETPVFFGVPNEATGLEAAQCQPVCKDCADGPWTQPTYTSADFSAWRAWTLENPPAVLSTDPYLSAAPAEPGADAVCGALFSSNGSYTLIDYPSTSAALAAGAQVTHYGVCGLCSSLADLTVYAETPDLTEPVRQCGLDNLSGTVEDLTACIAALGFTEPCASIWAYNTLHTRDACLNVCMAALDAPYNNPDGSLNACLQCDEDESGAVFKAIAGRTRRNTGLASSICRPCSEVKPLVHGYGGP